MGSVPEKNFKRKLKRMKERRIKKAKQQQGAEKTEEHDDTNEIEGIYRLIFRSID